MNQLLIALHFLPNLDSSDQLVELYIVRPELAIERQTFPNKILHLFSIIISNGSTSRLIKKV